MVLINDLFSLEVDKKTSHITTRKSFLHAWKLAPKPMVEAAGSYTSTKSTNLEFSSNLETFET